VKVVLAEKPSVARDLAAVLGARTRKEGFLEGNGYQVTWAFGHLVSLKEPEDYDPALKRWTLASLPILPPSFGLKLTGDEGARRQYGIVEALFRAADELICATDAGREGELIFRYILELSRCGDKPVQRLWLNSMTEDAIRSALGRLAPASQYDDLYAAARCRSEADWIIGMNATRNYTVRYGQSGVLWSVGRVQTPVLALIVGRDDEIRHFVATAWFELRTRYRGVLFRRQGDRLTDADAATALLQTVVDRPFSITGIETRPEQELPPQLFDLTALQREMNVRHGMSAADVLVQAQALYESKLITYPRSDSRYLPSGMRDEVAGILQRISAGHSAAAALPPDGPPLDKRIFDDARVSDHHAILPTGRSPGSLAPAAQRVYDAIVTRLIAAFLPPCKKEVTTVDGAAGGEAFRARGVRILDPGWTVLQPKAEGKAARKGKAKAGAGTGAQEDGEEADDKQELPGMAVGESGPHRPEVKHGETRPPRHYNENTLLAAMETAGKLVEDDELKEALKARGLGTPATRAAIIETLLRRAYIRREKKSLIATDLGRYLIALIQHPMLKSPEMTGEWEARLREVEAGRLDARVFMQGIASFTTEMIAGSDPAGPPTAAIGACPLCGKDVVEGQRGFGCSAWRQGCRFVLWKDYRGHTIPLQQARELLQRRLSLRSFPLEGDRFVLALDAAGRPSHIALPRREHQRAAPLAPPRAPRRKATNPAGRASRTSGSPAGPTASPRCPRCAGPMVERSAAYGCAASGPVCDFAIPKTIAGKAITKAMARRLLLRGRTQLLKGFTSKSQRKFDARLRLEDGRIRFEFEGGGAEQGA
jgi:DNA topoisomerase-3